METEAATHFASELKNMLEALRRNAPEGYEPVSISTYVRSKRGLIDTATLVEINMIGHIEVKNGGYPTQKERLR